LIFRRKELSVSYSFIEKYFYTITKENRFHEFQKIHMLIIFCPISLHFKIHEYPRILDSKNSLDEPTYPHCGRHFYDPAAISDVLNGWDANRGANRLVRFPSWKLKWTSLPPAEIIGISTVLANLRVLSERGIGRRSELQKPLIYSRLLNERFGIKPSLGKVERASGNKIAFFTTSLLPPAAKPNGSPVYDLARYTQQDW